MWVAVVAVTVRLSVVPSPQSTLMDEIVPSGAELVRVIVTVAPVFAEEGPLIVTTGCRGRTIWFAWAMVVESLSSVAVILIVKVPNVL